MKLANVVVEFRFQPPLKPLSALPLPPYPIQARRPLSAAGAPPVVPSHSEPQVFRSAAEPPPSSAHSASFAAGGATIHGTFNRRRMPQPSPDLQALEQDYQNKVKYAVQKMEGSFEAAFQKLTDEMQGRLDAMNRRHQDALDAVERKQKAEWSVMAEYFNRLQERLLTLEKYVTKMSEEFMGSHIQQYHRMYDLERNHGLRTDIAFNTLFRHMQGNEGVFDRWANRLSRIESTLGLPVGTFEDYNPIRIGDCERALKEANADAADTADKELWRRLMSLHEEFEVFKGKYRGDTPQPQPSRGNTPTPEPGPSRFPGSYRSHSPEMSNNGKPQPPANDEPDTPRVEPPHSDDVEIVGWSTELPRKSEDDDEVEIVEAAQTTKEAAEQESGDIEMEEADAPPPVSAGPRPPPERVGIPARPGDSAADCTAPPPWREFSSMPQQEMLQQDDVSAIVPIPKPVTAPHPLEATNAPQSPLPLIPTAHLHPLAPHMDISQTQCVPPQTDAALLGEPPSNAERPQHVTPPHTAPPPATAPASTPFAHADSQLGSGATVSSGAAVSSPQTEPAIAAPPPGNSAAEPASAPPVSPPVVNIIPPTPQNSQPESGPATTEHSAPVVPAAPVRAGREVEATRMLSEMWGADTSLLPPGPPATRTRGRSRANSAQPSPHSPIAGLRTAASAGDATARRASKSPAPANRMSPARPHPPQ